MSKITQLSNAHHFIDILDPQNNELIARLDAATQHDALDAIASARRSFNEMKKLSAFDRINILKTVAKRVEEQREDFAQLLSKEGIKTINEARKEVSRCIETLTICSEEARQIKGKTIPFDQSESASNRMGYTLKMPIGVILAITPFNDPLNLVAHKIGPAIAAGNSVILMPHPETPLVAIKLVELFCDTVLPENALQVITGFGHEIGDTLVEDERIDMVSFTGGREVGDRILAKAGLKKVALELGSNCPVIIFNDAKISDAVDACVSGAFWAAGQNCLHVQRIYVHDTLYDEFKEKFCAGAKCVKIGDKQNESTTMGPIINERSLERIDQLVQQAIKDGANLLVGGERFCNFYLPTVLELVSDDHEINTDEIFGPVTILHRFQDLDEAIEKANAVDLGLHAGVFTQNLTTAMQVSNRLEVGGVMINDSSDYRIDAMPFGGVKGSGIGREGVASSINEMTYVKTFCFNL